MNILVVNDDGIFSEGIRILAETMKGFGNVYVVAPHKEQSAIGHGLTIHEPFAVHNQNGLFSGIESWSIEGKPADCVKFAVYGLKLNIDFVVSGVNNGPNIGTDVFYSGTVAAASEAVLLGIPAIAFSADYECYSIVKNELSDLILNILNNNIISNDYVINVNFPSSRFAESKGLKITDMGKREFIHDFVMTDDGKYWSRGKWKNIETPSSTDAWAYNNGFISLTPLQLNRTAYNFMDKLSEIEYTKK